MKRMLSSTRSALQHLRLHFANGDIITVYGISSKQDSAHNCVEVEYRNGDRITFTDVERVEYIDDIPSGGMDAIEAIRLASEVKKTNLRAGVYYNAYDSDAGSQMENHHNGQNNNNNNNRAVTFAEVVQSRPELKTPDLDADYSMFTCCHGEPASLKMSKKGENNGRYFFSCAKPFNQPGNCGFFMWFDEKDKSYKIQKDKASEKFNKQK